MSAKSDEERIIEIEVKMKELETKKKQLEARRDEKARKERTRNLIQIGAIIQSLDEVGFGVKDDVEIFKKFVTSTEQGQLFLNKYLEYHQEQLRKECDQLDAEINRQNNNGAIV